MRKSDFSSLTIQAVQAPAYHGASFWRNVATQRNATKIL